MMRSNNSSKPSKASLTNVGTGGSSWRAGGAGGGAAGSTSGGGGIAVGGTSVCTRGGGTVVLEDPTYDRAIFLLFKCVPSRSICRIVECPISAPCLRVVVSLGNDTP